MIDKRLKDFFYHPLKRLIAKYYLRLLRRFTGIEVIAITGSAGKTTTKEMIASILVQKFKVQKSFANVDPVYNIPSTILKVTPGTEKLILEMGIEYPDEMDSYLSLAKPDIGIITNINLTHTEFLGDIKNVVKEKGKIVTKLNNKNYAILNLDDTNSRSLIKKVKAKTLLYGKMKKADVRASRIKITSSLKTKFDLERGGNKIPVELPLIGEHFVSLALAAASIGSLSGLSLGEIKAGLESVRPSPHRMRPIKKKNFLLIDDTYNANPLATYESLKTLSIIADKRRKIFVFGDMKELGRHELKAHKRVGEIALEKNVDILVGFGKLAKEAVDKFSTKRKHGSFWYEDKNVLIENLKKILKKGDVILVKGSRSMKMEEIVDALVK